MTNEEYDLKMAKAQEEYNERVRAIKKLYATENNPYHVGMIVSDHKETIRIETVQVVLNFGDKYPSCSYVGPRLKKDGTPFKSGEKGVVYQSNMKSKP